MPPTNATNRPMTISYRFARSIGLATLLLLIFFEGVVAFIAFSRNSDRLDQIITNDEVSLTSWHNIAEIITEAKDRLYDYRTGRVESIAAVDLLINKAVREVRDIRKIAVDTFEKSIIDEILTTAATLKQAVYLCGKQTHNNPADLSTADELEAAAIKTADHIVVLGRSGAAYVSDKIKDKHSVILEATYFSQTMMGLAIILGTLLTAAISIWLARSLAKPIEQLVDGTRRLASGELSYQVQINSSDEIGQLARSFNTMAKELKHSQHELLVAKSFTDNIIKSMLNTLVVVNMDDTIRMVNEATCNLLGYDREQLVGRHVSKIFSEGYYEQIDFESFAVSGFQGNIETSYMAANGKKYQMLLSGSVMRDDIGDIEGLVFVAQDISMQAEALRAGHLASLGELAAGVAHEINNPMNSIINFAQILIDEMEEGDPQMKSILAKIIAEGDRISAIVRSLLSFAREGGKQKDFVCLYEVINETMALSEIQIRKDGINFKVDVPLTLPRIEGNFQQLQQVFLNIINNSRYALNKKYPGAHADKILQIKGSEIENGPHSFVAISVFDHGIGVPASIIDKIKNPFFSTKPAGKGTGLGLAISHGIISAHGGKIDIESIDGEYTKMTVLLPTVLPEEI